MAQGKIVLTGIKEIDAKIRKLADTKRTDKIVKTAIRNALKGVLQKAKANTPVRSGAMKRSLKIKTVRSRRGVKLVVRLHGSIVQKLTPGISTKSAYAYPNSVEFGSVTQDAQHPIKRAYDSEKEKARDQCVSEVRDKVMAALNQG